MGKTGFGNAKEAIEGAQKTQQQTAVQFTRFSVKAGDEPQRVRFLVEDGDDSVITFTEHWTEFNNGWNRNFECPNENLGDNKCLICNSKRGTDYIKDTRKVAHMINLIDRSDNQLKVWKFSAMAMQVLLEQLSNLGSIADRDFYVEFIENNDENIKAKYYWTITPATTKPEKMSKEDVEIASKRYNNLSSLIPAYNQDNLAKLMKMTPESGTKNKQADLANKFMSTIGTSKSTNIADDFSSLLSNKKETVVTEKEDSDSNEDFMELLKSLGDK